jgi:flagellar motility protein MotE (MotC chaperone)
MGTANFELVSSFWCDEHKQQLEDYVKRKKTHYLHEDLYNSSEALHQLTTTGKTHASDEEQKTGKEEDNDKDAKLLEGSIAASTTGDDTALSLSQVNDRSALVLAAGGIPPKVAPKRRLRKGRSKYKRRSNI